MTEVVPFPVAALAGHPRDGAVEFCVSRHAASGRWSTGAEAQFN
jgi:hypothetical protein